MTLYQRQIDSTLAMIKRAGRAMSIRRVVAGTVDPLTEIETGGSTTDYACYGVATPPGPKDSRFFDPSTLIERDTVVAYVAASGLAIVPATGDTLIVGTKYYAIHRVGDLAPDGANILFALYGSF